MLLTLQQAATRLGKSVRQVRYMVTRGELSGRKVEGRYLRYMDDLTLFAESRGHLLEARDAVVEWLWRERRLTQSGRGGAVVPAGEPCSYLGARISRAGLAPSRKLRRRLGANVRRAAGAGEETLSRCLRSYRGLMMVR